MPGHRLACPLGEVGGLFRRVGGHVVEVDADGQVGQRVVGAGLVGDDVDRRALGEHLRQQLGGVAEQADGERLALVTGLDGELERVLEAVRLHVQVAVLDPALDGPRVDIDTNGDAVVHGDGERLGAAHAAE